MKRLIFLLIILMTAITMISFAVQPISTPKTEGVVVRTMTTAPSSLLEETGIKPASYERIINIQNVEPVQSDEQDRFCEDIPLTNEEQVFLQSACEEFEVPYALALGLIEQETDFRNIICDNGASTGYMQVQKKWHWDRMERLGVTDLSEPNGNFRVGLDYLSELYGKYEDWSLALTVYNMGHNPGYITDYAKNVMGNYERWQELLKKCD